MVNIRKGTFETNSSSTHSLVYTCDSHTGLPRKPEITDEVTLYDFFGDDVKNGILAVHFGEYGWEGDPCDSFRAKLSYLLTGNTQGYGMNYNFPDGEEVEIDTNEKWEKIINGYFLKEPMVEKILGFIRSRCPNIKGFKFYWYDQCSYEMDDEYRRYTGKRIPYGTNIDYNMEDKFFHDPLHSDGNRFMVGFGFIDHQSAGLVDLSQVNDVDAFLERYLFDDNLAVMITNDNR